MAWAAQVSTAVSPSSAVMAVCRANTPSDLAVYQSVLTHSSFFKKRGFSCPALPSKIQGFPRTALTQVADQHHHGAVRECDQRSAVGHGLGDVGAPPGWMLIRVSTGSST